MMNKKNLPRIITVVSFVVVVVLGQACSTLSTALFGDPQHEEIRELAKSRNPSLTDLGLFGRPPSEGETVLNTFQDSIEKSAMPTISAAEAQAYANNRVLPKYDRPSFYPYELAASLMIKAKAQFPEIEIEDLDVRSLEQVGDVHIRTNLNPNPIPNLFGGPAEYSFYAYETVTFKGAVVKRAGNNTSADATTVSGDTE